MGLLDDLKKRQEQSQPTATTETTPEPTHDIEKTLAVNPPPVTEAPVEQVKAPIVPTPTGGTQCPTCGKIFKQITRHKCAKTTPIPSTEANAIEYPTEAMLNVILPKLEGPELDEYAGQYGITRYMPGDDPKFRETIKTMAATQRAEVAVPESLTVPKTTRMIEEPVNTAGSIHDEVTEPKTAVIEDPKPEPKFNMTPITAPDEAPYFDLMIGVEVVQNKGSKNLIHFHDMIHVIEAQIKTAVGMHWTEVEYGKGKAALIECLEKAILDGELNKVSLVVSNKTHAYTVVADLLRQYARNVVIGV